MELEISREEIELAQRYLDTPVVLGRNPFPGEDGVYKEEGDDAGYRRNPTDPGNYESLVVPAGFQTRSFYDGVSSYTGGTDPSGVLPGGVEGGSLLLRETGAKAGDYIQAVLRAAFDGEYQLIGLDGFRSGERQRAGWDRLRLDLMKAADLTDAEDISVSELYRYGIAADDTFSFVSPDESSEQYRTLAAELRADRAFMQELEGAVRERLNAGDRPLTQDEIEEGVSNYIAFSANANKGRAAGRDIPLTADPMAHNSGIALDAVLADENGMPLSSVPFDFPGELSAMNSMEGPQAYEIYCAAAQTSPGLRAHLKARGLNPDKITQAQFEKMKRDQRLFHYVTKYAGASMYKGENWHVNLGLNPTRLTGVPLLPDSPYMSQVHTHGSNTCDARLRLGARGIAAFGGNTAEFVARRDFGLGQ